MYFRCSRNRHYPRLLSEDPGKRDLGWCGVLPLSNYFEQFDKRSVGLPRLRRKTGHGMPKICAVKRCALVDLSGEVALPEWTEGNKADSQLFESWNDLSVRLPPPQ